MKHIEEHKKENTYINSIIMRPKTAGKGKGKSGTKGALKGAAGGSKDIKAKALKISPKEEPIKPSLGWPLIR